MHYCRSCILIESIFFAVKEYLFVELVLIQIPRFKPQDGQLVTFFLSLRILYLHVITLSVSRS